MEKTFMRSAFGRLAYILKNNKIRQLFRSEEYEQCVLPVTTGYQTWTITKQTLTNMEVTKRSMRGTIIGISLRKLKQKE